MKAVDDVPDVLISDYRMPGMDGRQLLEKLKSRPATAGIAVIMMASKADISERLSMQDPIEDYLEKPFFLKDATHKIKRVVDRIALEKLSKAASSDGLLRGSLSQMNVIDLVQSLEMGRKSCLLTMTNAADKCEIYVNQGQASTRFMVRLRGTKRFSRCCAGRREISRSISTESRRRRRRR